MRTKNPYLLYTIAMDERKFYFRQLPRIAGQDASARAASVSGGIKNYKSITYCAPSVGYLSNPLVKYCPNERNVDPAHPPFREPFSKGKSCARRKEEGQILFLNF